VFSIEILFDLKGLVLGEQFVDIVFGVAIGWFVVFDEFRIGPARLRPLVGTEPVERYVFAAVVFLHGSDNVVESHR
jgi:hypothetical protein